MNSREGITPMERLPEIQLLTYSGPSPSSVRVLAEALQMFEDRPPRTRMEFSVCRKLTDQMRSIVNQPDAVAQVFRLSAEFPAVEALVDDFLMSTQIARSRERHCGVLDQLMQRLTDA